MILNGIVNNITNFGCFVDLGIKKVVWYTYLNSKQDLWVMLTK
jgi:ribosomal protein S1